MSSLYVLYTALRYANIRGRKGVNNLSEVFAERAVKQKIEKSFNGNISTLNCSLFLVWRLPMRILGVFYGYEVDTADEKKQQND